MRTQGRDVGRTCEYGKQNEEGQTALLKSAKKLKLGGALAISSAMSFAMLLPGVNAFAQTAPTVTLTASPVQVKQSVGSSVTYTASSTGITNPEYNFWVEMPDGQWVSAQNYSSKNTFTLSNLQSGNYLVTVYALSASDVASSDYSAAIHPLSDGVFVNSSVTVSTSSATLTAGQPFTVTASSTGIYNPQYQFWYKNPSGVWKQDPTGYGSDTFTFTPTETGNYEFVAYAKSPDAVNTQEGALSGTPVMVPPSTISAPILTPLTVSGQTTGIGTVSSPATVLNGGSLSLSTTLEDASGNPMVGVGVTYNVSEGNAVPQYLPTVSNNGNTISGSSGTTAETYTVYTNAEGQADVTMSGPSGQTIGYTVSVSAPFQSNGATLTTSPVTVEFVASGQIGITPLSPYDAVLPSSGLVPITVTLPPSNGVAQANVPITFSVASTGTGFASSSNGSDLGTTETMYTNSAGQATGYVDSASVGTGYVMITSSGSTPVLSSSLTVNWTEAGIPNQIAGLTASNTNPNAGQDVTWTGTVEDAAGNPVPSTQVLVAASGSGNGTDSYVSGTTTTAFPDINASTLSGYAANSNYGDVVTTNAAGQFSVEVTNSSGSDTDHYYFYGVQNGVTTSGYLASGSLTWSPALAFSAIGAYSSYSAADAATTATTSVTGLENGVGMTGTAYFAPFTATQMYTDNTVTYQVSANNGADITGLVGTSGTETVTPSVPSLEVTVTYNASSGNYTINYLGGSSGSAVTSTTPIFGVDVTNSTPGDTVLTVASGTTTATATFDFISGTPAYVTNFPAQTYLNEGSPQTITYTVEDAAGNPVSDAASTIAFGASGTSAANAPGLWITAVNGVTLQTTVSGTAYPTPIPLSTKGASLANYDVNINGLAFWTGTTSSGTASLANSATVYTNSSGVVSLTLQTAPMSIWNGNTSSPQLDAINYVGGSGIVLTPAAPSSGSSWNETNGQVYFTGSTYTFGNGYSNIGQITW